METIRRRIKGVLQDVPIYTEEEGRERGLDMVHWKEVKEGQWAITDDGYVTECTSRRTYRHNGFANDFITTTCGRYWASNKLPFSFEERRENKSYNAHSPKPWIERQASARTTKMLVHAVSVMWLSNKPIDYNVLANIYSQKNASKPGSIRFIKYILKSPKVKKMIRKEIEAALLGQGMTIQKWLELGMDILERAEEANNIPEMRRMWEQFGDVLQVKEHESRQIPAGEGTQILEAVDQDLKKLPAMSNAK